LRKVINQSSFKNKTKNSLGEERLRSKPLDYVRPLRLLSRQKARRKVEEREWKKRVDSKPKSNPTTLNASCTLART